MNEQLTRQLTPYLITSKLKLGLLREVAHSWRPSPAAITARSPISPAIVKALVKAKKTWEANANNQNMLKAMRKMDLHDLVKAMRQVALDPTFAPAFALGKQPGGGAAAGSFSIGLAGQVDVGVGAGGSLGLAFDPNDHSKSSVFVSVGVIVGADAEADAGLELGVWSSPPDDMAGLMAGAGFGLDAGFGVGVAGFTGCEVTLLPPFVAMDYESWGATLTLTLGAGGGVSGTLCYTSLIDA